MPFFLLAIISGIFLVSFLPSLPTPGFLTFAFFGLIAISWIKFSRKWLLLTLVWGFFGGILWGTFYGQQLQGNVLPEDWVGEELLLTGRIIDLPVSDGRRQRFLLEVESYQPLHPAADSPRPEQFPQRIQLSWYDETAPIVRSGEQWQWIVKLKKPRGFVNPGGFDYQAWLLRRGIGAVGYVRPNELNQKLNDAQSAHVDVWRYNLRKWLMTAADKSHQAILVALLIGDRSLMDMESWQLMQSMGVNHLIAISGMHIGFVALLGLFFGVFIGRWINIFYHRCPALLPGYFCAITFALGYSLLAGLTIPTQRAFIMVLVIQWAYFWRRSFHAGYVLLLSLLAVVINDPLAAYDMGFWLSYGAVAVLLFGFAGRYSGKNGNAKTHFQKTQRYLREFLRSQHIIFIGLMVPLIFLTNTVSILAPLANFIAIPLVTFIVVPFLLGAAVFYSFAPRLSEFLLQIASCGLDAFHYWLDFLDRFSAIASNPIVALNQWTLLLAAVSVFIILLPAGIPGRLSGYLGLCVALLLPQPNPSGLTITVLDVGQGTAVVVQTAQHTVLYDTGPAYSESFEAGAAIVVPFLQQEGINKLDKLVVSHSDKDHAGGLNSILKKISVDELLLGDPEKTIENLSTSNTIKNNCHDQSPWVWDNAQFEFLSVPLSMRTNTNNHSCVLLITYAGKTLLLTGDIDTKVEHYLLSTNQLPEGISILLAPHHGSRTSSADKFVQHTRPEHIVFSAGYRNQHRHPHPLVVERYVQVLSNMHNTATGGALRFHWDRAGPITVDHSRVSQRRYWFAQDD